MEYVKLGEVATFINGYAFKPSDWKKEGIPIIRIQNLTGNNREINYYQGKIDEKYHVKKGEILISWSASIDVYEWKGENGYLNQHIFKVVFDKMDIDKDFFVYLIKNKLNEIKKYTHGSTMKHITKSKFDNIKIRIPSKEEQIKIANKLNKIIIIIEKQKEQLELLENLKKSQFLEEMGNPIKNDKGWKKVKLSDVSKIIMGQSPPSSSYNEKGIGMPFYQGNVDFGEKYPKIKKYTDKITKVANENTILMSVRAPVGELNITKIECCIGRGLCSIKINGELNLEYLFYYLKNIMISIKKVEKGSTFKSINRKEIENIEILLPPLELQNKFATKIETIQKLKFEIEKSLKETENLYNSLMQKFFSNK